MNEKEIIKQIKNDINVGEFYGITEDAIKELLDLYNKQKEKLKAYEIKKENVAIIMRQYGRTNNIINKFVSKDKIINKINELTLKNKVPIKDQFVMYDCIKRNFQIEILEELLNEEGDINAK